MALHHSMLRGFSSELSAIYGIGKEAGLLNNAGNWMAKTVKPVAHRVGTGVRNQYNALGAHMGEAMARNPTAAGASPFMPVPGVSHAASGISDLLKSKVPAGPRGLLRRGVGAGVSNALETLANPSTLSNFF